MVSNPLRSGMRFTLAPTGEVPMRIQQSSVRNRILKGLSPEDFERLRLEPVRLPVKLVLVEPHVPIAHLYFMEEGMTSITTDTSAGQIEVGMIGREGLVAASPVMLGVDQSLYCHFVQMPGEGLRIATEDLVAAVEQSPSLRLVLMRGVQALMDQMAQTAFANAVCTIEIRLARWLLMCRDRAEGDEMSLTHEILAKMLGVRRPGISVATQILEGRHLIKAKRGRITVLDRTGLQALAGESYGLGERHRFEGWRSEDDDSLAAVSPVARATGSRGHIRGLDRCLL